MFRLPALIAVAVLLPAPGQAGESLPLFDAHIHYSQPAWERYPPAEVARILDRAGVSRALVSSTPNDGTEKLFEAMPRRVVPELRPYRTRDDMGSWHRDPAIPPFLEEQLKKGIYRGIGEFHLHGDDAKSEVVKIVVNLALVGTDTWVASRWEEVVALAKTTRRWLAELPKDVAEKIAYKNAESLFGS